MLARENGDGRQRGKVSTSKSPRPRFRVGIAAFVPYRLHSREESVSFTFACPSRRKSRVTGERISRRSGRADLLAGLFG